MAGDDARLEREIARLSTMVDQVVAASSTVAALGVILRYLSATHGRRSVKKVVKLIMEKAGPRTREGIVTWLDEIELKGERRGERKGERKGRVKSLLQLLAARFGEVPAEVTARVEAADERELDRWTVRVLTAPTPEAVIDDGASTGRGARSTRKPTTRKRAARAPGARRAS